MSIDSSSSEQDYHWPLTKVMHTNRWGDVPVMFEDALTQYGLKGPPIKDREQFTPVLYATGELMFWITTFSLSNHRWVWTEWDGTMFYLKVRFTDGTVMVWCQHPDWKGKPCPDNDIVSDVWRWRWPD